MTNSEILLYQTEDGQTKIDVRLEEETVWLSQVQIAELFQTTKQNISLHIKNIYEESELEEISTVKDYLTVQTEGYYCHRLGWKYGRKSTIFQNHPEYNNCNPHSHLCQTI